MVDNQDDDLKATAEDIAADAGRLQAIEAEKAELDVGDPRVAALSVEGEQLARRIVPKTVAQRELADDESGA